MDNVDERRREHRNALVFAYLILIAGTVLFTSSMFAAFGFAGFGIVLGIVLMAAGIVMEQDVEKRYGRWS